MYKRAGEILLEHLSDLGVEYFIGTAGTEFAPIIETFCKKSSEKFITPITVPHEYLAINIAYGIYLATGKPAAVMVHSTIGTLNCAAAVMNAFRMNIPILILAGMSSSAEYEDEVPRDLFIHWAQESFDQAGALREFLKWDYVLKKSSMMKDALSRAYAVAMAEKRGPVYLTFPRELLLERTKNAQAHAPTCVTSKSTGSKTSLIELVNLLRASKKPIVLTKSIGVDKESFDTFQRFCDHFQIPVFSPNAHYLTLPHDHPSWCGENADKVLHECDLLVVLDMDVPWIPSKVSPDLMCKVVHIAPDPLFEKIPMRTFRSDLSIRGNVSEVLMALIEEEIHPEWDEWRRKVKDSLQKAEKKEVGFTKKTMAEILSELWSDEFIIVNELSFPKERLPLKKFGSYYRTGSASGLGWACGCALGLGLTQKNRVVLNIVGDGAYYFGNPLAYHWMASALKLPLITIVLNNSGMHSIAQNVGHLFENEELARRASLPLLDLNPSTEFDLIAPAFGGRGYKAKTGENFREALILALGAAKVNHQQSIINAILEK